MFQIGALNPQSGNDRRKQLLQTLMQQFMQKQGAGMPGQPAPPTTVSRPMLGAPTRAGTPHAATTQLTNGSLIPAGVLSSLGPGGQGRAMASAMSPAPGMPVPGFGRGGTTPAPGGMAPGTQVPAQPIAQPPAPGTNPYSSSTPVLLGTQTVPNPSGAPGTVDIPHIYEGSLPSPTALSPGAAARAGIDTGGAVSSPAGITSPSGLIPLGNGVFLDPTTGAIHGVPTPSLGGAARASGGGGIFTRAV